MLPKADKERRLPMEPFSRIFEYCPDCGEYLHPGFRTDMCVFCFADFSDTQEFKEAVARDKSVLEDLYASNPILVGLRCIIQRPYSQNKSG